MNPADVALYIEIRECFQNCTGHMTMTVILVNEPCWCCALHRNQGMLPKLYRPHDYDSDSGNWTLLMLLLSLTKTYSAISIYFLLTLFPLHALCPRCQDCRATADGRAEFETVCQWTSTIESLSDTGICWVLCRLHSIWCCRHKEIRFLSPSLPSLLPALLVESL